MITSIMAMTLALPLYHFGQKVVVNKECTPKVAFYQLQGYSGEIEDFNKNSEGFYYDVRFYNKHLEGVVVNIPEACLRGKNE